jgi:ribosomal protein S18 acetylase RimI-like enzyme
MTGKGLPFMSDSDFAAHAFDVAFAQRAPDLHVTPEADSDRTTLRDLFAACSPLGNLLAGPLLEMQFASQDATMRTMHPLAMRRVVRLSGELIGRIIVDWQAPGASHCVDIAVHPNHQKKGIGRALLQAWLAVADAQARVCTLDVIADNPVRAIYAWLGFVEEPCEPDAPYRHMVRAARG